MTRDEIDLELLKFLRENKERERREDNGLHSAIGNLSAQVQVLETKIDANNTITQERLSGLSSRVTALEKDAEDTGVHNIADLREKAKFWPGILEKIAVAVVIAALTGGVTYAITKSAGATEAATHAAEKAAHP